MKKITKSLHIETTDEQWNRVKRAAGALGMTLQEFVVECIKEKLENINVTIDGESVL